MKRPRRRCGRTARPGASRPSFPTGRSATPTRPRSRPTCRMRWCRRCSAFPLRRASSTSRASGPRSPRTAARARPAPSRRRLPEYWNSAEKKLRKSSFNEGDTMNRMFAITVAGVLAALPGFATAQAQEIKIGVIYTVEGAWGSYGQKSFRGIRMSAEDINAKGGVNGAKIKLIEYDNRASPNELPNIVRRLATVDNVLAIIGPNTSGADEIVFPIADQLKVPALGTSVATGSILNKNRPYAYRNNIPADQNTT